MHTLLLTTNQFTLENFVALIVVFLISFALSSAFPKPYSRWVFIGLVIAFLVGSVFGQEINIDAKKFVSEADVRAIEAILKSEEDWSLSTEHFRDTLFIKVGQIETLRKAGGSDGKIWADLIKINPQECITRDCFKGSIDAYLNSLIKCQTTADAEIENDRRRIEALINLLDRKEKILAAEKELRSYLKQKVAVANQTQAHRDSLDTQAAINKVNTDMNINANIQQLERFQPKP